MKRKKIGLFLLAGVLALAPMTAQAKTFYGEPGWKVAFTSEKKLDPNFTAQDFTDAARGLQPGDEIHLTVAVENQYGGSTDWYMKNDITKSLEEASKAEGGVYTYVLTYKDKGGKTTTLFSSDTVGGETEQVVEEGLKEATKSLDEYFYLDTLTKGQTGQVDLLVVLDGVTQGNDYQDTLAELQLSFAVELDETTPTDTPNSPRDSRPTIVRTGDPENPFRYILLTGGAGLILLILAIWNCVRNRKEEREMRERKGAS